MEDRGFEKKTSNGIQWLDIKMIKSVQDYADSGTAGAGYQSGDPGPGLDDDMPA